MIPLARTHRPEAAATLLLRYFRTVLVQAHYDNYTPIRFRADLVKDDRVFFGKTASQIKRWHERGGCLVSWRRVDGKEGENDALLFAECPKSFEGVYAATGFTAQLAVIYVPPTWRPHEATIAQRHKDAHPAKHLRQVKRLKILRDQLPSMPLLTQEFLDLRFSRLAPLPPKSAPESPEAAARSADTIHSTPGG